jgi:hypothetical protein
VVFNTDLRTSDSKHHITWAALLSKCGQRQTLILNMMDMPGITQQAWKKAEGMEMHVVLSCFSC